MSDTYNPNESGINPVDSATGSKDIYFSNEDFSKKIREEKKAGSATATISKNNTKKKKSSGVTSTYLFFIIVIAVSMLISVYAIFCLNDIFGITKTKSTITVSYDDEITSSSDAIDLLANNKLITCKNFCKLFIKLESKFLKDSMVSGPYEAGVYYLNGKMGLENMLVTMQGVADTSETVHLVFPEGYTVADIINKLVDNDVCDRASLLKVISSTSYSYSLVSNLEAKDEVPYRLEGYLFPDSYDFYIGQSASSAIETFLKNTEAKITEDHRKRAEELGYTIDEIIIIASIIQAEAGSTSQMKEIAAVIENRLKDQTNYPSLGCQSTSDYITNKVAPSLSSTSAHTSEYYLKYYNTNTDSEVIGLPEGPICNPGIDAIEAALYPADSDNYYFFHDLKGNLYTAKNLSEFRSKIKTYAPYLDY
ncbi:MAG: endolytic transglycosylase MltG [Eubacterium sp.]|nr:endolytic transglycosylase MltG [Eubacterium sp.]